MASKATFYSVGVYQVVMPQRSKAATFFTPNFITEQNAWRPQNLQINSVLILLCFMIELHRAWNILSATEISTQVVWY